MKTYTIQDLKDKNLIIFEVISGSRAYGTDTETSDTDIRGIYIQPLEDILSFNYIDQVSDSTNDTTYYEIRRFLELLQSNNPNILEILYSPNDCILYKHPIMDILLDNKQKFLSKQCKNSFGGYAVTQIKKARGLNKKMNWEESEITRKTVLDFCYVLYDNGSIPFKKWLELENEKHYIQIKQEDIGLSAVNHAKDTYALFKLNLFNIKSGVVSNEETANDVMLTSIPKGLIPNAYLVFNKDGYSCHCKKYKEYREWLEKRNIHRVNLNKAHGKAYDGKNFMHCVRLLKIACEIAEFGIINVRRPNREYLLSIKRGELEYNELLKLSDELSLKMKNLFDTSSLPEFIDFKFVNELLLNLRKQFYNIC